MIGFVFTVPAAAAWCTCRQGRMPDGFDAAELIWDFFSTWTRCLTDDK